MLSWEQLNLLRELSLKPRTRQTQDSFSSYLGIKSAEELFEENGLITVSEDGTKCRHLMTITDKGKRILVLCESLLKEGVTFD